MSIGDMDLRLRGLFERQRQVNDPALAKVIGETASRWGTALSDSDLEAVAAAGEPDVYRGRNNPWDGVK